MESRAAQFAPFAALTTHEAAIKETARQTGKRLQLDDERIAFLNDKVKVIADNIASFPEIEVTYFVPDLFKEGGEYETVTKRIKTINMYKRIFIFVDNSQILMDDIYNIESEIFKNIIE